MLAQGLLDLFFDAAHHLEDVSNFSTSALKRHLLKRHLTHSPSYESNLVCLTKVLS